MKVIPVTPEHKAESERFAQERGTTLDDAVDDALATFLEWEREDHEEAVDGIRSGYDGVKAGRTRPAREFLDEPRRRYDIPR